ncbi:NnrU family protein [Pusillimonas sp.]|uniref:NnrU family protein n=1 Tax=Pusillimonas sp. TaxID=3040095 RepID=UPI0037CA657B
MLILIIGLIIFLGIHSTGIVKPRLAPRMSARLGEHGWKGLYSIIAIIGLLLVIYGYGLARQAPSMAYIPPAGLRHLTHLLMLPVFILLFATYFPGRIKSAVRHPMLWATILWAVAHLLSNGSWADVLLFGGFLVWAIADLISMSKRPAKAIPSVSAGRFNDAVCIVGGLVVYGLFVGFLHRWLFGVAPM